MEDLLSLFEGDSLSKVLELSSLPTASALVLFENRIQSSPEYLKRTVVAVGAELTHKSVSDLNGAWIYDGLRKQVAVSFCLIEQNQEPVIDETP